MTYSSSGPDQVKAPDADPLAQSPSSNSSSSSSTSSHSRSHLQSDSHPPHVRSIHGKRHAHVHRYDSAEEATGDHIQRQHQTQENQDVAQRHIDSGDRADHSNRRRSQDSEPGSNPDIQVRDDTSQQTGYITHVVQTVSLVQVVDFTGSPIAIQTHYATPNTIVVDSASGSTVSVSNPESSNNAQDSADMTSVNASTPGVAVTASSADTNGYLVPTQNSASNVASLAASTYSLDYGSQVAAASTPGTRNVTSTVTTDSSSSVSTQTTLTDISSQSTSLPTTSDASTSADSSMRMEMISTSSSTIARSFTSSSISSTTSPTSSSTTTTTTSTSDISSTTLSSTVYTYSTEVWTSTQYADDGSGGGGGNYGNGATAVAQPADPTTTSDVSESSGSTLSNQQKQVIGGVVGSIAGVAFLAFLILLAIKHKKRHGRHALLGEGPETRTRGMITDGDGGGSSAAMAERSAPFSVAATLAGLSSKRSTQTSEPAPASERGFYRVSGKKLPSVLHNGGDGYTDPREINRDSVASGHTDYWRGSQAFVPSHDGGSTKLALGSPMRPVSGVPIIRTGPARTPVTEENPFADPTPRPRPDSDALGDSVCAGSRSSQDGSWNSPSRFQERI